MRVLLLKDIYKLGHAGDVKKVADGYARNYLIPQNLATPATAGALKQSDRVRSVATELREKENLEKAGLAGVLADLQLTFPVRASEQGKLYGSVTHQLIADAIEAAAGEKIDRRSVMAPPLRQIGTFKVPIRLTSDLVPAVTVIVHHEDEEPGAGTEPAAETIEEGTTEVEEEPVVEEVEQEAEAVEATA